MSIFNLRHYKEIAKVISEEGWYSEIANEEVVEVRSLANMFEKDNPKFKRLKFMMASCEGKGGEEE